MCRAERRVTRSGTVIKCAVCATSTARIHRTISSARCAPAPPPRPLPRPALAPLFIRSTHAMISGTAYCGCNRCTVPAINCLDELARTLSRSGVSLEWRACVRVRVKVGASALRMKVPRVAVAPSCLFRCGSGWSIEPNLPDLEVEARRWPRDSSAKETSKVPSCAASSVVAATSVPERMAVSLLSLYRCVGKTWAATKPMRTENLLRTNVHLLCHPLRRVVGLSEVPSV